MNVLLYGYGLMGKKTAQALRKEKDLTLIGIVSPVFDETPSENTYLNLGECGEEVDAIIDFSHPNNLEEILKYAISKHCALVLATTGYNDQQLLRIEEASSQIPIFQSYNMSFGIQMLTKIIKLVSKEFFENGFDIEILEKHHNQKIDAPSGTAKLLFDVINEDVYVSPVYDRSEIKQKRQKNEIGMQSIRGGTIFGEHDIMYAGNDEIVEIKHTALSKEVFVQGAIAALKAIAKKENGLYTLKNLY